MCKNFHSSKKKKQTIFFFVEVHSPCAVMCCQFPLKASAVIHAQFRCRPMRTLGCLIRRDIQAVCSKTKKLDILTLICRYTKITTRRPQVKDAFHSTVINTADIQPAQCWWTNSWRWPPTQSHLKNRPKSNTEHQFSASMMGFIYQSAGLQPDWAHRLLHIVLH